MKAKKQRGRRRRIIAKIPPLFIRRTTLSFKPRLILKHVVHGAATNRGGAYCCGVGGGTGVSVGS